MTRSGKPRVQPADISSARNISSAKQRGKKDFVKSIFRPEYEAEKRKGVGSDTALPFPHLRLGY